MKTAMIRVIHGTVLLCLVAIAAVEGRAQTFDNPTENQSLPAAPEPAKKMHVITDPFVAASPLPSPLLPTSALQSTVSPSAQQGPIQQISGGTVRLSRRDAEQLAIKNNPQISVGRLLSLAQHQVSRETRSAFFPTFSGNITAVDAHEGTRIGAGTLNAPLLLEHAGAGVTLSQLLTDFGRTTNLASAAKLREKAQNASALATTEDIVLATDQAFYTALEDQALLKVAQQIVTTRQSVEQQIEELAKNKLKSTLDLTFAQVNLSQAKLLQLDAQNNFDASMATLAAILGFDHQVLFELNEEETQPAAPPADAEGLIRTAFRQRPDLQASGYEQEAAEKFRRAQRDQLFPTVSALGTAGGTPVRPDCFGGCSPNYFISSWYGAIGVNMSIPIFNGFLFSSQAAEAKYRAQAASENTRDLRDRIARDVRTAWLAANTAFQRVTVTAELAKQADLSLSLAQSRYQLGLGSIVELSQAQLQQTDAAIGYVNAQYQYRLTLSTLNFETGMQP
jgi:outer membrane protein